MKKVCVLMLIVSSIYSPTVLAAETILSLYQKALNYDAQYKLTVANTEAQREEINKAKSLFLPKVQFAANTGKGVTDRTSQSSAGTVESHFDYTIKNYALSVKQPLFNKESLASYRGSQAVVKSSEALLLKENATLISRVANAYFETLYAQERVSVTTNKIDAVQHQLEQAKRRYDHGEGTITEINEAQANLDLAQTELIDANNALDTYKQTLSDITGEEVVEVAALIPDRLPASMPQSDHLQDWLEIANANNPEIMSARFELEAAQQDVERRRAGHYPTLDLVGVRSYSENDNNNTIGLNFDSTTVSLQFNLPIYAGGYTSASVRQSLDRMQAAEEQLNLSIRNTGATVKKYFNSIHSGLLSIQAYEQAVKSSEIALLGTQKGFVAGMRTNIDVLNAQQKLYSNQLELSKVRYTLINDIIGIQQATGALDEQQLYFISHFFS